MTVPEYIILIALLSMIYTLFVYPVLLFFLSKFFHNKIHKVESSVQPEITVCIAAWNEEENIAEAIESIFQSNYLAEKIFVRIGSDGSTDSTVELAKSLQQRYPNISVFDLPRGGKNETLNAITSDINTPLTFYMDCDCRPQKDTFMKIIENFYDDNVGLVLIPMVYPESKKEDTGSKGEKIYQKYELLLRRYESRIWGTCNNIGPMYALRTELDMQLPNNMCADDNFRLFRVLNIGKRAIFDESTCAYESRDKSLGKEFQRKIRILSATVWAGIYNWQLLLPWKGWSSIFFWSHKMMRWALPLYLIFIIAFSFFINQNTILFDTVFWFQVLLYGGALLGFFMEKTGLKFSLLKIPLFFVSMNIAYFLGYLRLLSGLQNAKWTREGFEG